jgi:nucleoside-triphosphatase
MTKNLFLAGKPASGKTTLIKAVCLPRQARLGGFYTEEIREGSERLGFRLKTFDGREGVLARKGMPSAHKLNKYGVDLGVLETIGIAALRAARNTREIIVIDEIGSMEIISEPFRRELLECLNAPQKVLATIRYNAQPFTDEIKRMADTALLCLTRATAASVRRQVEEWIDGNDAHE